MSVSYGQSPFDLKSAGLSLSSPWASFDKLWQAVMGYPAASFRINEGKTPMTTSKETAIVITLYYVIILGGRELMRTRPAYKLNDLFLIHNFYLTVISGALLALFVEQLIPSIWNYGVFDAICGGSGWTKELTTLYYVGQTFLEWTPPLTMSSSITLRNMWN
jgi:fatty acid elongase 3